MENSPNRFSRFLRLGFWALVLCSILAIVLLVMEWDRFVHTLPGGGGNFQAARIVILVFVNFLFTIVLVTIGLLYLWGRLAKSLPELHGWQAQRCSWRGRVERLHRLRGRTVQRDCPRGRFKRVSRLSRGDIQRCYWVKLVHKLRGRKAQPRRRRKHALGLHRLRGRAVQHWRGGSLLRMLCWLLYASRATGSGAADAVRHLPGSRSGRSEQSLRRLDVRGERRPQLFVH